VAFVGIGGKPIASIRPGVADWRRRAAANRHCVASPVLHATTEKTFFMCVPISDRANFFWLRPCITLPKLVRVDRVFVLPKAEFRGAGGGFCRGVGRRGIIVLVVPCKAGLEHFEIDVAAINENSADGATVAVGVVDFDADVLAEDKRRKMLL